MKKWFSLFALLTFSLTFWAENETLQKAEKAYDSKHYKTAIDLYEQLLKQGYSSYQLYYNLGNSYYKNGEIGRAIHSYEIARKLEPNEEDIKINLSIANSKTINKIETKENFFITAVKSNILSSMSTKSWAWLNIFCLIITCSAFFLFYISNSATLKRVYFLFASIFLLLFFSTYLLGNSAVRAKSENKFAIVFVKEVKVLSEPTVSATTKFRLHEGTKVRIVENNGNWMLIKLENGNEGWLESSELGVI